MRYAWQAADWQRIRGEFSRLPNAWLFAGPAGIGKRAFAEELARAMLCESPLEDESACGVCEACRWFAAGHHPDYRTLSPDDGEDAVKEGKSVRRLAQIKIEAVRDVIEFAQLTAHRSGRRVVLVEPAEAMNPAAANALLKILEEPPHGVLFLLVSHHRERLLPTIKSRCRPYVLTRPSHDEALAHLAQEGVAEPEAELAHHGGVPLFDHDAAHVDARRKFLAALSKPTLAGMLSLAESVDKDKLPLGTALGWLMQWVGDLAGLRLANVIRYHPDWRAELEKLAARAEPAALMRCYDALIALAPFAEHTLNVRLQLEAVLTDYLNCFAAPRAAR
ncbi:DNA polymerase III subunit delta' [Crenobacter cavernae]|uniref:DNA polymerase III subunit delta' n=1 Tax=Crenobacter cavernae TaxID=2290923 RepID=A0A345Y2Y2_9NEIS|nr:DNA polymerase III subunit delta' [Crenobacter cavernae]AXK38284.1 DNA polymerase III subunit delta' [Crenobacter cavernae]